MAKTIVLILEGATPSLLDSWCGEGLLPNLNNIFKEGAVGKFKSLDVPYEPPSLISAFSGLPPGEHGCFSYWKVHNESLSNNPEIINSNDVKVKFLWDSKPASKLKINVVNLFGTHPPKRVNGNLISYPLKPSLHTSFPKNLIYKLSTVGISYGHDVSALYTGTDKNEFLRHILNLETARQRACIQMLKSGGDLFIFNITIIDRISHFWWIETEPESKIEFQDTLLYKAYKNADNFLRDVRSCITSEDNMLVFSEIGFGPLKKFISVNNFLEEEGLLKISNGYVDEKNTYAMEAVQGCHGVNINFKNRYSNGIVSESDKEVWLKEVRDALLSIINPFTEKKLLSQVHYAEELYKERNWNLAPDLVMIPNDEEYQPLGNPFWATKVHRHLQTGWHRRESFWVGIGPGFKQENVIGYAVCEDLAQTIASCLGLPPTSEFGKSLTRF